MLQKLAQFRRTEVGSVTTDWVVLAAAVLFLGVVVASSVIGGALTLTYSTNENLVGVEPEHFDQRSQYNNASGQSTGGGQ